MSNLPPVGAQAVVQDMAAFSTAINQINAQFASLGKVADSTTKQINAVGTALSTKTATGAKTASRSVDNFSGAVKTSDIALGSFIGNLATQAVGAVASFGEKIISSGVEMARTAGRADELRLVAQYVGASYGQTTQQVDDQIAAIQKSGIRYDMAARAVVDMTEAQLDMSKSTDLVKIAQASAIKSGADSSATLQNIIYGIRTLQPEVLRTAGITTSLEEAMASYTDEAGNHIKAVTGQEKQQALFNSVMQKGAGLLGLYDAAMQEPEKRLRSLDRVTYEISRTVGENFKLAFGGGVGILEYFTKSILKAVSDGGAFQETLLNVGGAAAVFSDGIANVVKSGLDFFISSLGDTTTAVEDTNRKMGGEVENVGTVLRTVHEGLLSQFAASAESALSWGINIVTELADGIIQGASGALIAAMDFIGGILSSFLSPGSPPKVAPDIDTWGADAMDEYLKGFTEADYGILESVQGPLQSVLELMGKEGEFGALNAELAQNLSAVADGAAMSSAFLTKLSNIGGVYGQELSRLVSLQTDFAGATSKVTEADKAYEEQQKAVEQLTKEYEDLSSAQETQVQVGLLGGYEKDRFKVRAMGATASPAAAEKKAELDLAKAKLDALARDKQAAKEREAQAKALLSLQEKLVKQLIEQAKWQEKLAKQVATATKAATTEKKPAAAKKGAVGGATVSPTGGGLTIPKIGPIINEELDKAKAGVAAKLGELFAPLTNLWKKYFGEDLVVYSESGVRLIQRIPGQLDVVIKKFEWFKGIVVRVFAEIGKAIQPVVDWIKKVLPPDLLTQIGKGLGIVAVAAAGFATALGIISVVGAAVGAILGVITSPIFLLIAAMVALKLAWDNNFLGMRDTITAFWTSTLQPALSSLWKWLQTEIPAAIKTLSGFWNDTLLPAVKSVWDYLNTQFIPALRSVYDAVATNLPLAIQVLTNFWNTVFMPVLQLVWSYIQTVLMPMFKNLASILSTVVGTAVQILTDLWDNIFYPVIMSVCNFITQSLNPLFLALADLLTAIVGKAVEELAKIWKEKFQPVIEKVWDFIEKNITPAFKEVSRVLRDVFGTAVKWVLDNVINPFNEGLAFMSGFIDDAIKKINGLTNKIKGGAIPGIPAEGERQGGGPVSAGLWRLHDNEYVLSDKMRRGVQPIAPTALTAPALARLVSTPARNGLASVPASRGDTTNNRNVSVEINPSYQQVQTPASLYYDVLSALHAARV